MNYLKLFENFNDTTKIASFCKKYGIKNYTINDDGSIDVNGDVYIHRNGFANIPIRFNRVSGSFDCSSNGLTSLEGCPKYVGNNFYCSYNNLRNLIGGPEYVGGGYSCEKNGLLSLEGCASYIGDYLGCSSNKLSTLEYCPETIRSLSFDNNQLTTLNYFPKHFESVGWNADRTLPEEILEIMPPNLYGTYDRSYVERFKKIIGLQDEFMIWNSDGSLNKHNFQELMKEIR